MTDLEKYEAPAGGLVAWAEEAKAAHALATSLAKTSFAGGYKGKPEDATAAIMKGAEIGLTPLAALGSIHLIQGTPALSANALRAVVQAQGHEVWIESSSEKKAVAKARRKGSDVIHTSTWTIDRATALGLTGKQNWRQQAEAMLIARATSEVCRLVASDAILGIAHSVEELTDGGDEPAPTRRRTVAAPNRANVLELAARGVEIAGELPGHEQVIQHAVEQVRADRERDEPAEPELLTKAQSAKLHALYRDIGWTDRDDKLRAARAITGRTELTTSAQLTKAEASELIDELDKVAATDDPAAALTDLLEAIK